MKSKIEKILKEIASEVIQYNDRELKFSGYGLMAGLTGDAIFLNEVSKIDKFYSKYRDQFIDYIFDSISENNAYPYHCAGISGACLGLQFLFMETTNDGSFEFAEGEISDYIDSELIKSLENQNLDFLHGAIGLGFYYLERIRYGEKRYVYNINLILKKLTNTAIEENEKIRWHQNPTQKYANISLSHGMSSVIIFLSDLLKTSIKFNYDVKSLLIKSINYVLDQEIDFFLHGSLFPYASKESGLKGSRLAWCYGDLGIGIALYKSSLALRDKELETKSLEIFNMSASRRDLQKNLVLDASICHGSAGISIIFHDMFLKTGNNKYLDTAIYWTHKTVELYEEGKIFYISDKGYRNQMSLLEGKIGIALSFLAIYYETPSQWKKFFLI